jgi:hypothetical protein
LGACAPDSLPAGVIPKTCGVTCAARPKRAGTSR